MEGKSGLEGMEMIEDFYRGRKVLITGHTGFKGSWLTIWLDLAGARLSGIALDPVSDRDLFVLADLKSRITDHRADIRNAAAVDEILKIEKPVTVFHMAAQSLVLDGYKDPSGTFETNIMGTVNVLEACRKTDSVKQVVIITTDKVYENREEEKGYREGDPLGGYDPYSASKAGAEIVSQSYGRSFFLWPGSRNRDLSIATVRAGNVIGGGDRAANRIIPDCVRALENGWPAEVRNPDSVRPWQHVLEPLAGYLELACRMAEDPPGYSGPWNFGPDINNLLRVKDLVSSFISHWDGGSLNIAKAKRPFHEAGFLMIDSTKAGDKLGWRPLLDFQEAIRWTADWYRKYNSQDAYQLCKDQIEKYTEKWSLSRQK